MWNCKFFYFMQFLFYCMGAVRFFSHEHTACVEGWLPSKEITRSLNVSILLRLKWNHACTVYKSVHKSVLQKRDITGTMTSLLVFSLLIAVVCGGYATLYKSTFYYKFIHIWPIYDFIMFCFRQNNYKNHAFLVDCEPYLPRFGFNLLGV